MKDLNYYMNLPYEIIVRPLSDDDGGGYFARYKDFQYIMGDGESEVEAIADAKSAFRGAIEVMLENGDAIKEPKVKTDKTKSVAVTLRQSVIDKIDRYAKELGLSRSAFIDKEMSKALGAK